MNVCWPCRRNLHEGCRGSEFCECNHTVAVEPEVVSESSEERENGDDSQERYRRNKPDAALKDQQSTGRKRAAKAYPLDRSKDCEWRSASNSNPKGGGVPVTVGCVNTQQARHHGPDYNTLNNEADNVSRICHWHHNLWHRQNDPTRQPEYLAQFGHKPKQTKDPFVKLLQEHDEDIIWADPEDQV